MISDLFVENRPKLGMFDLFFYGKMLLFGNNVCFDDSCLNKKSKAFDEQINLIIVYKCQITF